MNTPTTNPEARRRLIAGRVKKAISLSGLTQKEIAARMEISEQYLSDIVNARRAVSAFVAVRLERVLGLDAHRLIIDQALGELECARAEFGAKVAA